MTKEIKIKKIKILELKSIIIIMKFNLILLDFDINEIQLQIDTQIV